MFAQIRKSMITIIVALVEANFISKTRKDCDRIPLFKKYNVSTVRESTIMLKKDSTDLCEMTLEIKLFFMSPYLAMKVIQ